jgi:hypothetical protein
MVLSYQRLSSSVTDRSEWFRITIVSDMRPRERENYRKCHAEAWAHLGLMFQASFKPGSVRYLNFIIPGLRESPCNCDIQ